uniref:Uncharacterized protein n=1 Tax=Setaria viridis TaxID=4556 RepID=A0A4U6TIF5_SETVI|nr:hypothetical protein SEVIR_8G145200v2 [Setaria viridis]
MALAHLLKSRIIIHVAHILYFLNYSTIIKQTSKFGRVGQFDIDTTSQPVIEARTDMLKSQQRQGRYRLKKKYFNGLAANEVPTKNHVTTMNDDQWNKLERCTTNTSNCGQVRYPQRTRSRSYVAQAHVVKQVEGDATPIDLFKNFHCNKNGYTAPVQAAIARMEQIIVQPGDDQPKTATEAVAEVVQSRTFREVAGIHPPPKKRTRVGTALQVEEIQADLERNHGL